MVRDKTKDEDNLENYLVVDDKLISFIALFTNEYPKLINKLKKRSDKLQGKLQVRKIIR